MNCCKFSSNCLGLLVPFFAGTYDYKYTKNILHIKSGEHMVVHVDRQAGCQSIFNSTVPSDNIVIVINKGKNKQIKTSKTNQLYVCK